MLLLWLRFAAVKPFLDIYLPLDSLSKNLGKAPAGGSATEPLVNLVAMDLNLRLLEEKSLSERFQDKPVVTVDPYYRQAPENILQSMCEDAYLAVSRKLLSGE